MPAWGTVRLLMPHSACLHSDAKDGAPLLRFPSWYSSKLQQPSVAVQEGPLQTAFSWDQVWEIVSGSEKSQDVAIWAVPGLVQSSQATCGDSVGAGQIHWSWATDDLMHMPGPGQLGSRSQPDGLHHQLGGAEAMFMCARAAGP